MPAPEPTIQPVKPAEKSHHSSERVNGLITLFSGGGARAGYMASLDQGLISLANFLATLLLARNVSPTELGVYGVGFTALRLVRAAQEGVIVQPLNAFGAPLEVQAFRRYATSTSILQVGLAGAEAAVVALLGWIAVRLGNDTAGPALFSLWAPILWWQLQEYIRRLLYARGQVPGAVLNTALASAARLGVMAWWLSQGALSGVGGLYAIALGSLAALIPGLWQTRDLWGSHFDDLGAVWRRNWAFGRWILGGEVSHWVVVEFYPVLTAGLVSFAAAGAYRALQNLAAPVYLILRAVDTFLTPRASKAFHQRGVGALKRLVRLTYLTTGIPILGLLVFAILFSTPILALLYGETYLEYSDGILLLAVYYALMTAYWPLQIAFKGAQVSRPIFAAYIAAMAVMFTLGLWMVRMWGVYGTIAGQAVNALVVALALGWAWRKFIGVYARKDG